MPSAMTGYYLSLAVHLDQASTELDMDLPRKETSQLLNRPNCK
jgi:hypothetical protein